jgi:hypothetical protein
LRFVVAAGRREPNAAALRRFGRGKENLLRLNFPARIQIRQQPEEQFLRRFLRPILPVTRAILAGAALDRTHGAGYTIGGRWRENNARLSRRRAARGH